MHSTFLGEYALMGFYEQRKFVNVHLCEFAAFGFVAQLLQMIPVLNLLAYFSNYVGAALWAARSYTH